LGQRLVDYALVALVILAVFGLFRLSRFLLKRILIKLKMKYSVLTADRILVTGFFFLLAGLLFLPVFTSLLALINNRYLTGGMILHLVLVAFSVILFSIAEDLFRDFTSCESSENWSVARHFRYISIPFLGFWLAGCLFLSPIFYSGLTVILSLFYLFALSCRPGKPADDADKSS